MSQRYSIVFKNDSQNQGSFCCFQKDPNAQGWGTMSLAWYAQRAQQGMSANFQWTLDYGFVWGQTGTLMPGVTFNASQYMNADPTSSNQVTLAYNGGFQFVNQMRGRTAGSLFITEEPSISSGQASVGIGMSQAATFVTQAQPNMNLVFGTNPEYWVAFGNYQRGQVLDTQNIDAVRVSFPAGVFTMYATLSMNGQWMISNG